MQLSYCIQKQLADEEQTEFYSWKNNDASVDTETHTHKCESLCVPVYENQTKSTFNFYKRERAGRDDKVKNAYELIKWKKCGREWKARISKRMRKKNMVNKME